MSAEEFPKADFHKTAEVAKRHGLEIGSIHLPIAPQQVYDVTNKHAAGAMAYQTELIDRINAGTHKLEFLYQYLDFNSRIVECELISAQEPYRQTCILKISAPEVRYYWNNLRADRPW